MANKNKGKGDNVRPIREGVEISKDPLEPVEDLVVITGLLHKLALEGRLRDLAYAGITTDINETRICGILGENFNFSLMDTLLRHLTLMHYDGIVFPHLTGIMLEGFDDE